MTREDLEHFRRRLVRELARLYCRVNRDLREVSVERVLAGDDPHDEADEGLRAELLETREQLDEREGAQAQEIEDALARVRDGTYGTCVENGHEIERARLEAIPWTPRCAAHARLFDEEQRRERAQPWPPTL